jgi:hypothetical protein
MVVAILSGGCQDLVSDPQECGYDLRDGNNYWCEGKVLVLEVCPGSSITRTDCAANGQVCNPGADACLTPCKVDTDCPRDSYCSDGTTCQPYAKAGDPCDPTRCEPGLVCTSECPGGVPEASSMADASSDADASGDGAKSVDGGASCPNPVSVCR